MAESNSAQSNEPDEAAYLRMKRTISENYPPGRLVAIHHGKIAADAERFQELKKALQQMGIDPAQSFVVEAGMDYPQEVVIFSSSPRVWRRWQRFLDSTSLNFALES